MQVPFLDLKAQYRQIGTEVRQAMQKVITNTAFAGGTFVEEFEEQYAQFCRCDYAIGVSSGTSALWLALLALDIGPGDEVITVPNSFIATAEAISYSGARPIFIDVDPSTYTMDAALLARAITPRTKAIIPVHLYGQPANMDAILKVADAHKVPVVEDACQAHGAEYKGKKAGAIGLAGCFSFYPGKNLGAYGEAGAVVTNDAQIAKMVRMLRDHGQVHKYEHRYIGWNARMDGLQGAVLNIKLKYLEEWNNSRRRNAALYAEQLGDLDYVILPDEASYAKHIYHVYSVRCKRRDQLQEYLRENGIASGVHYPVPIHLQEAYDFLGLTRGMFPVAERCADQVLSLPMFPELSPEQIGEVCKQIRRFFDVAVSETDNLTASKRLIPAK